MQNHNNVLRLFPRVEQSLADQVSSPLGYSGALTLKSLVPGIAWKDPTDAELRVLDKPGAIDVIASADLDLLGFGSAVPLVEVDPDNIA